MYSQSDKDLIEKIISSVDGWLYMDESLELAQYAKNVKGCIVEIGSYRGRSTIVLGTFSPEYTPIYAIDPHIPSVNERVPFGNLDRAVWSHNVSKWGLAAKVRPINLKSQDVAKVWSEPIGLCFIDGSHDYDTVKADLEGYIPHIAPDGILAVHDNNWHTVKQALDERKDLELVQVANYTNFYKIRH